MASLGALANARAWIFLAGIGLGLYGAGQALAMPNASGHPSTETAVAPAQDDGQRTAVAAVETGRDDSRRQEARFEFEPFGRLDARVSGGPVWAKWRALADEIESDLRALSACEQKPGTCASPALDALLGIVTAARNRNGRARLGVVNRAVNLAIRPTSDLRQHGVLDRWSGPLATFSSGQGDCEDYAIAKYVALRASGMPAEDLRLVIVRDIGMRQDHAVLTARLEGRWLVLDNRRFALVEDRHATQYVPLFALDMSGVSRFAGSNSILRRRTAPTG